MHQSFVDRGANGGLAGSDVRVLNTSSRQCTVNGINNYEIPGLDIVQCAALVSNDNGIVKIIMNEYAYYGKAHTTHSSGQIARNMIHDYLSKRKIYSSIYIFDYLIE